MPVATVSKVSRRRALLLARRVQIVQVRLRVRLQPAIERFFIGQTREAARRFGAKQLVPNSDVDRLMIIVRPRQTQMVMAAADLLGGLAGAPLPDEDDVSRILRGSRTRFKRVNQRTQRQIERIVTEGVREGLVTTAIADNIRALGPKLGGRAGTIARTEMALISQEAAFDRYGRVGVKECDIADGAECGWTDHDDGDQADGSRRTLAVARSQPLSHPNCQRVAIPVVA